MINWQLRNQEPFDFEPVREICRQTLRKDLFGWRIQCYTACPIDASFQQHPGLSFLGVGIDSYRFFVSKSFPRFVSIFQVISVLSCTEHDAKHYPPGRCWWFLSLQPCWLGCQVQVSHHKRHCGVYWAGLKKNVTPCNSRASRKGNSTTRACKVPSLLKVHAGFSHLGRVLNCEEFVESSKSTGFVVPGRPKLLNIPEPQSQGEYRI